jgi:hypothetical protein
MTIDEFIEGQNLESNQDEVITAAFLMNQQTYTEWDEKAPAFFERMEARLSEIAEHLTMTEYLTVKYVLAGLKLKKSLGSYEDYLLAELLHTSPWWILTGERDPEEVKISRCSQGRLSDLDEREDPDSSVEITQFVDTGYEPLSP